MMPFSSIFPLSMMGVFGKALYEWSYCTLAYCSFVFVLIPFFFLLLSTFSFSHSAFNGEQYENQLFSLLQSMK